MVLETVSDGLVAFQVETTEDCAFGKCGDCYTNNLASNGDFEFSNEGSSTFTPIFDPQTLNTTGDVSKITYLDPDARALTYTGGSAGTGLAVLQSIVSYTNFYQHLKPKSTAPRAPYWTACSGSNSSIASIGIHTPISTAASESMQGNFFASQSETLPRTVPLLLACGMNPFLLIQHKQGKAIRTVFSFDVLQYIEELGTANIECLQRLEVDIEGTKHTLVDFNKNLYQAWAEKKTYKPTICASTTQPGYAHFSDDRWNIDWKNVSITFTSTSSSIPISINAVKVENANGSNCGIGGILLGS